MCTETSQHFSSAAANPVKTHYVSGDNGMFPTAPPAPAKKEMNKMRMNDAFQFKS